MANKDLEDRTLEFAHGVIRLCKKLEKNAVNFRLAGQLIDASTSVGANYIEAREAVSKKDYHHRVRISRKECKESTYWLLLLKGENPEFLKEFDSFIKESRELRNILSAMIDKTKGK